MESKQSKQDRLSLKKHIIFSLPPTHLFHLFFGDSTLFSFHLWFPDEDFTPLATHSCSFLLTTVAQSDTVSLGDNRLFFF